MAPRLFTIGHSTHAWDSFVELLRRHEIEVLADVRRFPGSRRYPHFNQEHLQEELPKLGIEYQWFELLGGRRGKAKGESTKNPGLRNPSFQNYADYMETDEFRSAVTELRTVAEQRAVCFMCSEAVFWRCHRRLIADFLWAAEVPVQHIMPSGDLRPHFLTAGAEVSSGRVTYPS